MFDVNDLKRILPYSIEHRYYYYIMQTLTDKLNLSG